LSASRLTWLNLVAAPKHSGSRPVASGSSVPVWPAFSARSRPLGLLQRVVARQAQRLVEQQHAMHGTAWDASAAPS
jgi:hypothetical protein